jgi:predicted ATPase
MEEVSEIFEFVASNVDYWDEFLSGSGYPEGLSDEDTESLEAAKAHVDATVVTILHAAAEKTFETPREPRFRRFRPKAAATAKNRAVYLHCPEGRGKDMYYMGFCLTADQEKSSVRLYPFITVKKSKLEDIRGRLTKRAVHFEVHDFDLYTRGIELSKGAVIEELAKQAAGSLVALVDASADNR